MMHFLTFEGEDRKINKSAGFDAKKYWELRLESNYGLHGVGYLGLGRYYNNWLYRIRRKAFFKSVSDIRLDSASCSIIDIGSGTGFFVTSLETTRSKEHCGDRYNEHIS